MQARTQRIFDAISKYVAYSNVSEKDQEDVAHEDDESRSAESDSLKLRTQESWHNGTVKEVNNTIESGWGSVSQLRGYDCFTIDIVARQTIEERQRVKHKHWEKSRLDVGLKISFRKPMVIVRNLRNLHIGGAFL